MSNRDVMTVVVDKQVKQYPKEIIIDGQSHNVLAVVMTDLYSDSLRLAGLIQELIGRNLVSVEALNAVGFSELDAGILSLNVEGLTLSTPEALKYSS